LHQRLDDLRSRGVGQTPQLFERFLSVPDATADRKPNKDGSLELELLELGGKLGDPAT
jgi:hypothetical protein